MLQIRTIEPRTLGLLKELNLSPLFANCFLVGGTSLALQLGHRFSIDLDLFTLEPFDTESLMEALKQQYKVQPLTVTKSLCISVIEGVKVDVVHFKYPFAHQILNIEGIRISDMRDVAPMKLDTITKRGSKKDFYDMYYLFEEFNPGDILIWYNKMFGHSTSFHVVRSLTYFEDAEKSEMPVIFDKKLTWDKVKNRMIEVVKVNF